MDVWCAIRLTRNTQLNWAIRFQKNRFFLKPSSSVVEFGEIDTCGGDVHHEIELVLLGEGLKPTHMALGLDLTKRSVQDMLKRKDCRARQAFRSAVLGEWVEFDERAEYQLEINGNQVQTGSLRNELSI